MGIIRRLFLKRLLSILFLRIVGGKQDAEISVPLRYPWQYLISEGQVAMLGKHALEAEGKAG